MPNKVLYSPIFNQKTKRLLKKYSSLADSLIKLEKDLLKNPHIGISYGANIYKIRIPGEGKGKSGGYRVITYTVDETKSSTVINLITIFTKSEERTITKSSVQKILKQLGF